MIKKIVFLFFLLISNIAFSSNEKIALIIGNSKYQNLGSLNNTINDAKLIEKSLKEIGYKTQIVLDANEQQARKAIKNFAIESENSNIALVFYAGHGAQVLGENYLLPTDIDIPKRESDIQLSGIKVDDIVNTIHSKVKVIFLDACRDNPALIKSLSKGRGSYQGGLAPAKNTSFTDNSSGIFIAYATDSGNVALDGNEKDSPFSLALAKYIKEPISVDDMFSKVTKEVRQKTNNSQKPYKYASLEGVVCLTSSCQSNDFSSNTNFQINKTDKVFISNDQTRLAMLSEDNRKTLTTNIQNIDLPSNWILFNFANDEKGNPDTLWYINPSSIKEDKKLITFDTKNIPVTGKSKTQGSFIYSWVADCATYKVNSYETKKIDDTGKILEDFKTNDPEFVPLDFDFSNEGAVGHSAIYNSCNKERLISMVQPGELNSEKWHKLFSNSLGGDTYYLESSLVIENNKARIFIKENYNKERKLSDRNSYTALKENNTLFYQQVVSLLEFECGSKDYSIPKEQYYDSKEQITAYTYFKKPTKFEIKPIDPPFFLMKKFCKS
jgi:hypothetical protein